MATTAPTVPAPSAARVVRVPAEVPPAKPRPAPTAAAAAAPAAAAAERRARAHVGQPAGDLLRRLGEQLSQPAGQRGVLVGEEGRGEALLSRAARAADPVDLR